MSRTSSVRNILRDTPDAAALKAEHQISLLDATRVQERISANASDNGASEAEREDSDTLGPATPSTEPLFRKFTSNSIHQSVRTRVNKYQYRRYQSDRFHDPSAPSEEGSSRAPAIGDEASPAQKGYLERGKARANKLIKRKRTLGRFDEEDSVIDILYENQRGAFLFGVPMFSSSSLLNFDPKSWQNNAFRTSPVDIRNAQVPDPSWEWAWKSWYVDMSRDVDEEGWEYSFSFQKGFAWHGNHPWFHSFVRRRRWLRKRVRKHVVHKTKDKSHELTAEYFTIHPKTVKTPSPGSSIAFSSAKMLRARQMENDQSLETMEISDIPSLIRALRKAALDREKLVAVRKFVEEGGDELHYLAEHMPDIMSTFVYQSSRRHLLAELMQRFDASTKRKESLSDHTHDDEETKRKHDAAGSHADNLLKAVKAADDQVKKLEYWSDIKSMAQHGQTLHATDNTHWSQTKWQGLDPGAPPHDQESFSSKQHHSEPPPDLHKHPEHQGPADHPALASPAAAAHEDHHKDKAEHSSIDTATTTSGYTTAASSSKAKSTADKKPATGSPESDHSLRPYATAPETPADHRSIATGKPGSRALDGVLEEETTSTDNDEDEASTPRATATAMDADDDEQPTPLNTKESPEFKDARVVQPASARTSLEGKVPEHEEGVEVVEPKAIDADYSERPGLLSEDEGDV